MDVVKKVVFVGVIYIVLGLLVCLLGWLLINRPILFISWLLATVVCLGFIKGASK